MPRSESFRMLDILHCGRFEPQLARLEDRLAQNRIWLRREPFLNRTFVALGRFSLESVVNAARWLTQWPESVHFDWCESGGGTTQFSAARFRALKLPPQNG